MSRIKKIVTLGTLMVSLIGNGVSANNWQNISGTYNIHNRNPTIRFQKGSNNSYGFLDLYGGKNFNFEDFYSEARARKGIGNGFSVGIEYNGGSNMDDLIRPHLAYSNSIGKTSLDVRYSPIESTGQNGQQLGVYASRNFGKFGLEGWADFDYKDRKVTPMGELEASLKLYNISAVVRGEKYPWQKSPKLSLGIKTDF